MKYYEKKLPGFSIIYLHNSDECDNCQLAFKSDFEAGITPHRSVHKKKATSKENFADSLKPLKNLILEAQKLFKDSKFKFPMPIKPHRIKTLKKKKIKALKKTNLSNTNSKTAKTLHNNVKKKVLKPVKNIKLSSKPTKKHTVDRSVKLKSVKKKYNLDKRNEAKVPGKGTLKRKRWFLEKLNDKDNNYEDDLYEDQKFGHFQSLLEDETDSSEKYEELKTPVFPFSISPIQRTPSPVYRDCYSPTQLSIYRKGAEEYQYRRKKRKKLNFSETKEDAPKVDSQNRENDIQKRLEEVARILNAQQIQNEKASDSEEDQYFSDLLDDPFEVVP